MNKIYFKGYYGFENLGDDMFCVTADWIANNLWEEKIPMFVGNNLPQLSDKAIVMNSKNDYFKRIYELYLSFRVNNIIYFGGSVLTKVSGIKDLKFYLSNVPALKSKVSTIGTSIGPFNNETNRNSIKELLSGFKFVKVRDYSSLKTVENMGIDVPTSFSFDPAIIVKDVYPSLEKKKNDVRGTKIAVSICHYERYKNLDLKQEREREHAIFSFLENIIEKNVEVSEIVFFEFNGNNKVGDLELIQEFNSQLENKIKTKIVHYTKDTEKFCDELNECDFLIGTRLHSGILAYALNVPFVLVEYHAKCTEFLNTINHNYRFDVNSTTSNYELFNTIFDRKQVPGIIDPEEFRENFKKQVLEIETLL